MPKVTLSSKPKQVNIKYFITVNIIQIYIYYSQHLMDACMPPEIETVIKITPIYFILAHLQPSASAQKP